MMNTMATINDAYPHPADDFKVQKGLADCDAYEALTRPGS